VPTAFTARSFSGGGGHGSGPVLLPPLGLLDRLGKGPPAGPDSLAAVGPSETMP